MTGVETITTRILEEAQRTAEELIAAAQQQANTATERTMNRAKLSADALLERAEKEAHQSYARAMTLSDLQLRKLRLVSKREVLDQAFAKAEAALLNGGAAPLRALFTRLVLPSLEKGTECIVPAKGDEALFDQSFVDALNGLLAQAGKPAKVTLEAPTTGIEHGLLVTSGGMEVDFSLARVMQAAREGCEGEIAAVLFDGTEG